MPVPTKIARLIMIALLTLQGRPRRLPKRLLRKAGRRSQGPKLIGNAEWNGR